MHGLAVPFGRFARVEHLERRTEGGLDALLEHGHRHTRVALHVDTVECGARVERLLRGLAVEGGEGHWPEVEPVAEAEEPDDAERLRGAVEQHTNAVAHLEPVLLRGPVIHRDLAGTLRRAALPVVHEAERIGSDPRHPERGRSSPADALAVVVDELGVALHVALRPRDARDPADLGERRLRDALRITPTERACAPHIEVDARECLREHRVERLLDGVGEHVGRADERDAEQHGERGEHEAHLAGEQAPDCRLPHAGCLVSPTDTRRRAIIAGSAM